jgi:hypothetical protein
MNEQQANKPQSSIFLTLIPHMNNIKSSHMNKQEIDAMMMWEEERKAAKEGKKRNMNIN